MQELNSHINLHQSAQSFNTATVVDGLTNLEDATTIALDFKAPQIHDG